MKKQDIHILADETIKNLINNGYTIRPDMKVWANSGWSVVLGKGKTFMAIWTDKDRDEGTRYEYIDLHFSAFDTAAFPGISGRNMAMRLAGETGLDYRRLVEYDTQVIRLWCIDGRGDVDWWDEDVDEVAQARMKQKLRAIDFNANRATELEELDVTDRRLKMARMLKGFKNVRRDDLYILRMRFRNWDGTWRSKYTFRKYSSHTRAEVHFNATNHHDHVYTVC